VCLKQTAKEEAKIKGLFFQKNSNFFGKRMSGKFPYGGGV
jgi:hypothetical protein